MTEADDLQSRRAKAREAATRLLSGTPYRSTAELLGDLARHAPDLPTDRYGQGELIAGLEERASGLLGKEAAVFLPSGIMGQQAALRSWAERSGNRSVALHPAAHLQEHERQAMTVLHGLRPLWLTSERRQPTAADVTKLAEPFGTLHVELPLRSAGFLLPSWDELTASVQAARSRGAYVHFDGARLWESTEHFGRPLAQIAALADSVYVSFYKGLGGPAGAAVAGPRDFIGQVRAWQHRHGGQLFTLAPYVVGALLGLDRELPRLPERVRQAKAIAAALAEIEGVAVRPDPPHTQEFQIHAAAPAAMLNEAVLELAERTGTLLFGAFEDGTVPGWSMTEVNVGEPAMGWSAEEVRHAVSGLLADARRTMEPS